MSTQPSHTIAHVKSDRIEWQTIALAMVIYGGWLGLTFYWQSVPLWLLVPLAAWLIAWQSSFQHEVMHGHPTRDKRINDAFGWPPLSLWLPYPIYKLSHLRHHRDESLTDPLDDPESFYVTEAKLAAYPGWLRALLNFNQTLLGRLIVGPAFMIGFFLMSEWQMIRADRGRRRVIWADHMISVAVILVWVLAVCQMPLWLYLVAFVYAGGALTRIRSYAEHRFSDHHQERTAIVERGGALALLFLNNNLHVLHHLRPGVAWYRLPALYRAHRQALHAHNGGLVYKSYGEVFGRYLFRRHDELVHPNHRHTEAAE